MRDKRWLREGVLLPVAATVRRRRMDTNPSGIARQTIRVLENMGRLRWRRLLLLRLLMVVDGAKHLGHRRLSLLRLRPLENRHRVAVSVMLSGPLGASAIHRRRCLRDSRLGMVEVVIDRLA